MYFGIYVFGGLLKYQVTKIKTLLQSLFRVDLYKVRKEHDDGILFGEFERVNIHRGEAVAVLLHNAEKDTVILVRQFRLAKFTKTGDGMLWEIPAGMIEPGEKSDEVAIRETLEETGYQISDPVLLHKIILAPGVMNEYIYIYKACITDEQKVDKGGGLAHEGEHLEVHELPVAEIRQMIRTGIIDDAKTIIALNELKD